MDRALWITRKNYLCHLIKKVSDGHGGDDLEWLRVHCRETIEIFCIDTMVEDTIACYEQMVERLRYYPERQLKPSVPLFL